MGKDTEDVLRPWRGKPEMSVHHGTSIKILYHNYKFASRVSLNIVTTHKKSENYYVDGYVNEADYSDHFAIYTFIKLYTLNTYKLYQLYLIKAGRK